MKECNECRVSILTNNEYCNLCAPHMLSEETNMKSIEEQLEAIADILEPKSIFVPKNMIEAKCPSCGTHTTLLWDGADCRACWLAEKKAVKSFVEQSGDLPLTHFKAQEKAFRDIYGDEAYTEGEWRVLNSRPISSISFEATRYGIDTNTLLTNSEMEDLSRSDAEYEQTPHDLIDHGADFAKSYTQGQIRDIMRGKETPAELPETEVPVFNGTYISIQQKNINYNYYIALMNKATTIGRLGYLSRMLFKAIDNSKRTFSDKEGKEITVPTFLPSGSYGSFWAEHRRIKENLLGKAA